MTTLERVTAIVAQQLGQPQTVLDEGTDLRAAGVASMDMIEIVYALEEEFGISISFQANSSVTQFLTVGDIARAVDELRAGRPLS